MAGIPQNHHPVGGSRRMFEASSIVWGQYLFIFIFGAACEFVDRFNFRIVWGQSRFTSFIGDRIEVDWVFCFVAF